MLIHGYDFAFSFLNANDVERLQAATARYQQESQAELDRVRQGKLSYLDGLRAQCRAVMRFLDTVFGEGASGQLGLDGHDLGKAMEVLVEARTALLDEKKAMQDALTLPQNRAQRRSQKRSKQRKRASRPAPAVPFPDPAAQASAAISTPKKPAAAEMVARVDKQTRRKQLLQELAALEND